MRILNILALHRHIKFKRNQLNIWCSIWFRILYAMVQSNVLYCQQNLKSQMKSPCKTDGNYPGAFKTISQPFIFWPLLSDSVCRQVRVSSSSDRLSVFLLGDFVLFILPHLHRIAILLYSAEELYVHIYKDLAADQRTSSMQSQGA